MYACVYMYIFVIKSTLYRNIIRRLYSILYNIRTSKKTILLYTYVMLATDYIYILYRYVDRFD